VRRRGRPWTWEDRLIWLVAFVFALGIVLLPLACYGEFAYGDWMCGFKKCVTVKS